ncbi:MAG: ABC transporter ATP-binding protein [Candidatus Tectomicrobia bacterium]|uniref:ABC transporter ATP-binding protein n=1 Tax=Tectimicrobiota bacterium TaxID=2528274 RepID=A0A937VWA5_UNCTE|nr:ABC transporter ATP-binding protein [Candidatus Tectomicrobia bacterium]
MEAAVALHDVRFGYTPSRMILAIPTLTIARGETCFVFGPSGSGKTTLLGLLAGILRANAGQVIVLGHELTSMSNAARDAFRGAHIGYIFQMFNLIPYLNVLENILLPCQVNASQRQRLGTTSMHEAAQHLAQRLGIADLLIANVLTLSVGQQQRVAVARALLGAPELIIADEPTSALDADHRAQFLTLLFESCTHTGTTLIFVSHDRALMPHFDRSVGLADINLLARPSRL